MSFINKYDVLVVGGGVIGLSSAYFLSKMGASVAILDAGAIGRGCSYGNGGLIVPSHCVPLARPGILTKGLSSFFSPFRPFSLDPKIFIKLCPWLWSFLRYCSYSQVKKNIPLLCELAQESQKLYEDISKSEALDFGFKKTGLLVLFQKQKTLQEAIGFSSLLEQEGVEHQVLGEKAAKQMEPSIKKTLGAIYYPKDAHLDPSRYVFALKQCLKKMGVDLLEHTGVLDFVSAGNKVKSIVTTNGVLSTNKIILCAGAYTASLTKKLKVHLPLQAAQGHSLLYAKNSLSPKNSLILEDAKITVTPFSRGTRYAGLLNLCSLQQSLSIKKAMNIKHGVAQFLKDPIEKEHHDELWSGLRPCTPDGVPIISQVGDYSNLFVATGHAMLGMTLGPMSGKLIAELALDKSASLDISGFSLSRF